MGVVAGQHLRRVEAERAAAGERVGADDGARHRLGAVDAVGIGGKGVDAGGTAQCQGEGQQKFDIAAAAPVSTPNLRACSKRSVQ